MPKNPLSHPPFEVELLHQYRLNPVDPATLRRIGSPRPSPQIIGKGEPISRLA